MFPSEEDALEFLEDYNLDEARIKLLIDLGRIREAAGVHAKNGDMLKAVQVLNAPATYSVDHVRPTIGYLLTALRRGLTLEVLPIDNPIIPKLLGYANRLDKSAMTEQEVDEVSSFYPFDWWVSYLTPPACDVQSDPTC